MGELADASAGSTQDAQTPEQRLATEIYEAISARFKAQFEELRHDLDIATDQVDGVRADLQRGLIATEGRLLAAINARPVQTTVRAPKVNAPAVYDGKSKELADQFVQQVSNAAKFEVFSDDEQRILWAQSFLSHQALAWSSVITSNGDAASNPRRYDWDLWLAAFKSAYCTRDAAADALQRLGALSQGTKSITEYCTRFEELRVKLEKGDQDGAWVRDRFWAGLSLLSKEALVNSDYKTVEEAQEILLKRETRLADLEATRRSQQPQRQGNNSSSSALRPPVVAPRANPPTPAVHHPVVSAPPPATRDPNAMDVDGGRRGARVRKCYKCGQEGHLVADCPSWETALRAAVASVIAGNAAAAAQAGTSTQPPQGFA